MYKYILAFAGLLTVVSNVQALEIEKPITAPIIVTYQTSHGLATNRKEVYLMKIKLNPEQQQSLIGQRSQPEQNSHQFLSDHIPAKTNLGMNGVPVLDQGNHGTCVTFATVGALDAALGKGDYLSPLCQLELGSYLESEGYLPSGWDGSFGPWVLDQVFRFGAVSKQKQLSAGCAGVKEYPQESQGHGNSMTPEDFRSMSENIDDKVFATFLMSFEQRAQARFSDKAQVEHAFWEVKKALSEGNRVTIGTFLVISPYCSVGACARYHVAEDTWALTKEIETPPYEMAGHEMVIIGYDDNAIAVDNDGIRHKGLFTLRNSWGIEAGDRGNYYMTYDYFKKFVGELQIIQTVKS